MAAPHAGDVSDGILAQTSVSGCQGSLKLHSDRQLFIEKDGFPEEK